MPPPFELVRPWLGVVSFFLLNVQHGAEAGCNPVWYRQKMISTHKVEIITSIPHDQSSFLEGLFIDNGTFYESAGLYDHSKVMSYDTHGTTIHQARSVGDYFAEGLAIVGNNMFQLTYKHRAAFVYDFVQFRTTGLLVETNHQLPYLGEGWGLTTNPNTHELIMSNGSSYLVFRNPNNFVVMRTVLVLADDVPVTSINELEFINGKVWANVWHDERIIVIDPDSGHVEHVIDVGVILRGVTNYDPSCSHSGNTLNGIAFDHDTNTLWVSGKRWPALFAVNVVAIDDGTLASWAPLGSSDPRERPQQEQVGEVAPTPPPPQAMTQPLAHVTTYPLHQPAQTDLELLAETAPTTAFPITTVAAPIVPTLASFTTLSLVEHTRVTLSPTEPIIGHTRVTLSPTEPIIGHPRVTLSPTEVLMEHTRGTRSPTLQTSSPTQAPHVQLLVETFDSPSETTTIDVFPTTVAQLHTSKIAVAATTVKLEPTVPPSSVSPTLVPTLPPTLIPSLPASTTARPKVVSPAPTATNPTPSPTPSPSPSPTPSPTPTPTPTPSPTPLTSVVPMSSPSTIPTPSYPPSPSPSPSTPTPSPTPSPLASMISSVDQTTQITHSKHVTHSKHPKLPDETHQSDRMGGSKKEDVTTIAISTGFVGAIAIIALIAFFVTRNRHRYRTVSNSLNEDFRAFEGDADSIYSNPSYLNSIEVDDDSDDEEDTLVFRHR